MVAYSNFSERPMTAIMIGRRNSRPRPSGSTSRRRSHVGLQKECDFEARQVRVTLDRINDRIRFALPSVLCDSFEASVRKGNGRADGRSEGERAFQR